MTIKAIHIAVSGLLLLATACSSGKDTDDHAAAPAPIVASEHVADAPAHPDPHGSYSADPHGANPHGATTPYPVTDSEVQAIAHGSGGATAGTKTRATLVPDVVKGQWQAAVFILLDRQASKATEIEVPLMGETFFGDKKFRLFVQEFLPDLKINDDNVYTSMSNNPENPAAHVTVYEDGKEVFDGWLFSEFPGIHPFKHPRYGVTLKAGVPS